MFDREQILSKIWGYDYFGDTRAVDTQIKRIRQKIPDEGLNCKHPHRVWRATSSVQVKIKQTHDDDYGHMSETDTKEQNEAANDAAAQKKRMLR
ncbi:MAG: helix-turn-helix domain-containing protein [Eubacteriales bacterium]